MKTDFSLRPLHSAMNDSYSENELYIVFENQIFRRSEDMDIALLSETLRAIDDRPDEEAAPHKDQVWKLVSCRIAEYQRPVALGLTRRAIAILAIILALLLTGVAAGVIDWAAVFQNTYHEEQQEIKVENWTLTQKKELVSALKVAGYDMSQLPSIEGKPENEQDRILNEWINKQTNGEVNDWLYNAMENMKGPYDSWSLEDKAWFSQMLLENGSIQNGDFVNINPPPYQQEDVDDIINRAWTMAYEIYGDTSAEPETWSASLFYGYVYPDEGTCYWRVHFRDENQVNWFTVQVKTDNPNESEMIIVMQSDYYPDVG